MLSQRSQNIHNKIELYSKTDGPLEPRNHKYLPAEVRANRLQESFRTQDLSRAPERAAFQRDAQNFFEQTRPLQPLSSEVYQRTSLPPPQHLEEDWHRQFQRVNISTPPPGQLQQVPRNPETSISSPWHDEFSRFNTPPPPHFSYQPQVQHRLATMAETAGIAFHEQQTIHQPNQVFTDSPFDDEAFEQAFTEAENSVHPIEQPEIPQEEEPKLSEEEEADRLAETAGELFDRLQFERETDEKFRNSKFMALMKKLRDREVVVSGNEMVETSHDDTSGTNGVEETLGI